MKDFPQVCKEVSMENLSTVLRGEQTDAVKPVRKPSICTWLLVASMNHVVTNWCTSAIFAIMRQSYIGPIGSTEKTYKSDFVSFRHSKPVRIWNHNVLFCCPLFEWTRVKMGGKQHLPRTKPDSFISRNIGKCQMLIKTDRSAQFELLNKFKSIWRI